MRIEFGFPLWHQHNADGSERTEHCCGCWVFVCDSDDPRIAYAVCNECAEVRPAVFPGVDIGPYANSPDAENAACALARSGASSSFDPKNWGGDYNVDKAEDGMLKETGQAGEDRYFELLVTPQMRRAGADAIDDLFEAGSLEEKAEAAYRAMVAASNFPNPVYPFAAQELLNTSNGAPSIYDPSYAIRGATALEVHTDGAATISFGNKPSQPPVDPYNPFDPKNWGL